MNKFLVWTWKDSLPLNSPAYFRWDDRHSLWLYSEDFETWQYTQRTDEEILRWCNPLKSTKNPDQILSEPVGYYRPAGHEADIPYYARRVHTLDTPDRRKVIQILVMTFDELTWINEGPAPIDKPVG